MMENRNGTTETACPKCGGSGHADSGGVQSWGEPISIPCDCLTEQEEFLAWANEEYEVEEGYELNESNPAVMENKKGWMARAALPKRSKFRQHLDECADEVDTWPSYKREALKNPSPKCSTCHDQGEVFIGPGKVESHMLEEPEPIYAPCPDCEQPSPAQAEQAEVVAWRYGFSGGIVSDKACLDEWKSGGEYQSLMTVAQHERIVGALRFERQQMDRAFTACINERDAALANVDALAVQVLKLGGTISFAHYPAAQAGQVPEVSGIGRDTGHPRAVVLYLHKEPTDDDLRAIQDGLRSLAAAPQPAGGE